MASSAAAVQYHKQDLHIEVLDLFRVIGHAADQLAGDGLVKKGHGQAQHVAIDLLAQAADRSHGDTGQPGQLRITDDTGHRPRNQGGTQ